MVAHGNNSCYIWFGWRINFKCIYKIIFMDANNIEEKLNEMGLQFPQLPVSKGIYKRCLTVGNFLFVSGHVSVHTDGKFFTGKVGTTITEEQGKAAARQCALGILCSIKDHLGSFDR